MTRHNKACFHVVKLLLPVLALFSLPAFGDVEIVHQQGTAVFESKPETVLTFDLAALDTLDALGIPVKGVTKQYLPDYLAGYQQDQYENIGSMFEPDFEKVASMEADLIIVASRSSKAYPMLSRIAPTIDMSVWGDNYLDKFKQGVRDLARLFEVEEQAESRIAGLESKVETARTLGAGAGNGLTIMTNGGKLSAYGPGSRFGLIHDELGVEPVIKDVKTAVHGDPVSFEFILQHDPDWLFVVDRDAALGSEAVNARATLDNELIHQTRAFRNDQIVYLNTVNWYLVSNGLTAVDAMVDEILTALKK